MSTLTRAFGGTPDPTLPGATRPVSGSGHRPEIQGLRAVAVLLVAVHHVWFGRVSGGVDVFLLLTGFLITGSLVRAVERDGRVDVAAFWARLVRRLAPMAGLVLLAVLLATFVWLPKPMWRATLWEVLASSFYFENWVLAANSVDYLSATSEASPVQHFWSLAIQGQFYVLAPALVVTAAHVARRFGRGQRGDPRSVLLVVLSAVFGASLGYSIVCTATDQRWAYFDTGARLWELALGGILVLVLPHLRIARLARVALGWTGMVALLLCGALVDVATSFPGWIALWPTGAAVLVIVAGSTGSPVGADRLLAWRPLARVGDLAYPIYLWHWPVLVVYLEVTGRQVPTLVGGCAILALSYVLSAASQPLVNGGVAVLTAGRATAGRSLSSGLAFVLPLVITVAGATFHLDEQQRQRQEQAADRSKYPGAEVFVDASLAEGLPDVPVYPSLTDPTDKWLLHTNGCNVEIDGVEPVTCAFGSSDAERTIALVGNSHAGHWFPALLEIARDNDWRLVTVTKNACEFSAETQYHNGEVYTDCERWNERAVAELAELRPDAVVTTSTRTGPASGDSTSAAVNGEEPGERLPEGHLVRWRQLDRLGIDVIAIRDTPRLRYDAPECVDRNGATECVEDATYSMRETPPTETARPVPDNVAFIDMTDYICPDGACPAVIGNVLVMSDDNHLTATFSRSMTPMLGAEIDGATDW